jgi:hypothetical protein
VAVESEGSTAGPNVEAIVNPVQVLQDLICHFKIHLKQIRHHF